jgi:divalent metal cation (Fe/Co/Zn/Cd) transporter
MPDIDTRRHLLRSAMLVSVVSVVWSTAVGGAGISVALLTDSVALLTFGLGSVLDALASAVLVWRFGVETRAPHHGERLEMIAHRVIGVALLVTAIYVAIVAVVHLVEGARAESSTVAVCIAAGSILVLPFLAVAKFRLARRLPSRALRGDGVLTAMGAALAAAALLGLVLSDAFGWWWADAASALVIATALAREGSMVFRAEVEQT